MKISPIWLGIALVTAPATAPATAQVATPNPAPLPARATARATATAPARATATAPKMATVAPFISGLKEPQGMAFDDKGNLLVCDYGAGEILKFSRDGKPLGPLATGLNGPAAIVAVDGGKTMFVSERRSNRVLRFNGGRKDVEMEDVPDPSGLVWEERRPDLPEPPRSLWVASYSTSKVYRKEYLNGYIERRMVYAMPYQANGDRPGFRALAGDGDACLIADDAGGRILVLTAGGRLATLASDITQPSGLVVGPDREVYIANQGEGGQLIRLDSQGGKTVVAGNLGRPDAILFLDAKTVLVSNHRGNIWKVVLP